MMLQLSGVHAHYGAIHALHGVDLSVQVGEVVTLIGANGAGKSTLMMAIFGQPRASSGRVVFDGEDITGLPTHEIARRGIRRNTIITQLHDPRTKLGDVHLRADAAARRELTLAHNKARDHRVARRTLGGREQQDSRGIRRHSGPREDETPLEQRTTLAETVVAHHQRPHSVGRSSRE